MNTGTIQTGEVETVEKLWKDNGTNILIFTH